MSGAGKSYSFSNEGLKFMATDIIVTVRFGEKRSLVASTTKILTTLPQQNQQQVLSEAQGKIFIFHAQL